MYQQLSLLEDPPPADAAPVWNTLDENLRAQIVQKLAQMIAKTVADMEAHDE